MNVAISNLAWGTDADAAVAEQMRSLGVTGVEIAPTKVWGDPLAIAPEELKDYRDTWAAAGIQIVALQSLLFGRSDLTLFSDERSRENTLAYLHGMIRLGAALGARAAVFGSPKNRLRNSLSDAETAAIAIPFFRAVADEAEDQGICFCFEPNPEAYGCDWVTTTAQGADLVERVARDSFRLNLDAGGITLAGEDPDIAVERCAQITGHFHISEPGLAPIGSTGVMHDRFANALRRTGYKGWTSVEMRAPAENVVENTVACLQEAVARYR